MNLKELLYIIDETANNKGISRVFICGGTPRDKILNRLEKMVDLDITNGDSSIHDLGKELSLKIPNCNYKVFPDGHSQVTIGKFKIDLSSNFKVPGIKMMLYKAGINKPTDMQCELYSRDFTCNALLLSLDLKTIYDPTGLGIKDIEKKLIRTCLPAQLTLGSQNKRVVRIIYLAAKLGFQVDDEIIQWVKNNPQSFSNAKTKYLSEKIQKALDADKEKTIKLLSDMNLWKYVPPIHDLIPYMNSPERIS
jgi:tRNA nucleotidyltransferase/poly(A) polymerase